MSATIRNDSSVWKEGNTYDMDNVRRVQEPAVFPTTSYKEDKPNVWVFVNLILGIAIGILGVFFLIVPTVESKYKNQLKNQEVEYVSEINKNSQNQSSIQKENTDLQQKVEELQAQIDSFEVVEYDDTIYNELFKSANIYTQELMKGNKNDVDYVKIAAALSKVKFDKLDKQEAKDLYNQIKDAAYLEASGKLYTTGWNYYSNRKYDEALENLNKAYEYDPQNVDAIYFIGRSYHQLSDYENAVNYYTIVTEQFPGTKRASEAGEKMASIG
jgi:tetratricopeptide (TPR) repeat protein